MTSPTVNTKVMSSIPLGVKEDVHFVLVNYNEGRYETGTKFDYPAHDKGTMKTSTKVWLYRYHSNGRLEHLGLLRKYTKEPLSNDERV